MLKGGVFVGILFILHGDLHVGNFGDRHSELFKVAGSG
jgi:hypothetical protein